MPRVVKPHRKRTPLILLSTLIVAAVAGGLYYFLFTGGPVQQAITEKAVRVTGAPGGAQPPEVEKQPKTPPPVKPAPAEISCDQAYARISDFFSHLDQRTYVSFYHFKGGSEHHFAVLLKKLFAHPPVVSRETDSLSNILQNTAHFYRVLGRDNIFLIKDILESEDKIIEPTMADFYQWSLMEGKCGGKKHAIQLPLKGLYEYAGFFLNTLGGQSYLFRRSPRVRILTMYYSVLVIDRANEQGLNKYGIDIRPSINSLIEEMDAMQDLASRHKYLQVLQNLKIKYLAKYGG